ncbi:hypothetical protein SteCoe_990 [Stentor coeruleus]|uniref:Tyrosine-protein kinase ephrin type A/B receptor-like domain-containing protein n=1 Tax=Stentor coeruleus TaxID=5963 RepID=A0A1R2D2S4_9CILI|nr:hypothetical protein SteCoe_990 [Stentor coeruleus]
MFIWLIIVIDSIISLEISLLPSQGPNPPLITYSNAVYDETTSTLITIGGFNTESKKLTSEIYTFSLLNNTWGEIIPESEYIPEPFQEHYLYMTKSRVILVLFPNTEKGLVSDIFAFDLKTSKWEKNTLTGESISSRSHSSICSFTHNDTDYIAVYGGFEKFGYDENLYLIDSNSLISYKLPKNNNIIPGIKDSASLIYYQGKLFLYGTSNMYKKYSEENLYLYDLETLTWNIIITKGNINATSFHKVKIEGKSMYVYFGNNDNKPTNIVRKLDLDSYSWDIVGEINDYYFQDYCACDVGNSLYVLYSQSEEKVYAPIILISITDNPTKIIEIVPRVDWPRKRQGHCFVTANDKIYLIGGLAEDDTTYLDDVWELNIDTVTWKKLILSGDIFLGRAFMSCRLSAGMIFVLGGKNSDIIFGDTFYINLRSLSWVFINPKTPINTENYGSCSTNGQNFGYILFGKSNIGYLNTIIITKFADNSLLYSYRESGPEILLVNHVCWISREVGFDDIYIANGETPYKTLNRILYKVKIYEINASKFYSEKVVESEYLARTMGSVIDTDEFAFLLFGVMENEFVSDSIVYIDFINFEVREIKNTGIFVYNHDACHLRDSFYVFGSGGVYGKSKKNSASAKIFKITNSNEDFPSLGCGPGSEGDLCTPCQQGNYFFLNVCVPCPSGRYSNELGVIGMISCTLCPKGTYADQIGSSHCNECPSTSYCPLGTSSLLTFVSFDDNIKSNQPQAFVTQDAYISNINNLSLNAFIGCTCLLTLLLLSKILRERVKRFDVYSSNHTPLENEPILIKKTLLGGYFSFLFFISAIIITSLVIISYTKNNIEENKTLIPLVLETRPISSEIFTISLELSMYGGVCNEDMDILLYEVNINYENMTFDYINLIANKSSCIIEASYKNFSIDYDSKIVIEVRDFIAYARMINLTLATNSSIPNELSIIEQTIVPDTETSVFYGSEYNEFFIKATPSIFESDSNLWPSLNKGLHLSQSRIPTKGSTVNEKTINVSEGLYITIFISQSDTLLYTKRTLKTNFVLIFSGLLGTVFGIMGSFGSIMAFVESKFLFIERKIDRSKKLKQIKKFRKKNINFLQDLQDESFEISNTSSKVLNSFMSEKELKEL